MKQRANFQRYFAAVILLSLIGGSSAVAEDSPSSLLSVDRIYGKNEFQPRGFSGRWLKDGSGYTTLERSKDPAGGRDIVRHDPDTGTREVMVPAAHLIPADESAPLNVEGYTWSADRSRLLIYTNSRRVWRRNSRGDYWVLDRTSRELRKLGGDARPSTLMFAKFSPDAQKVAYVRENDIYVEDLSDGHITAVTKKESGDIINGTFDWVYEEELGLRDGFRWSPDGKTIAFWQLDTSGVREVTLINNTAGLYPRVIPIKYPKVGERNSASRIGVVDVSGGNVRWMKAPGDPRNHYIARMDWAENSLEIILQQLNRLQNTNRVMLANRLSGNVQTILTERDDAWVDTRNDLHWLSDGERFTWTSERDGWRHVYVISRDGRKVQLATPGKFDAIQLLHADEKQNKLYFIASPDNAAQRYLYCASLDGSDLKRLTPTGQSGTHSYSISSDGRWAAHTWSSFDSAPMTELVRLPSHEHVRWLQKNEALRKKLDKLNRPTSEFFRVEIGDGLQLDGWCIKPPGFDDSRKYPLIVYVYGEPAGQTVLDRWGGSSQLWHWMLAQRGYLVMSIDNRGTKAPKGRAWRKSVYRQIGVIAPKDQAAALKKLIAERPYIDSKRIGIWGWSGGGSMSLNAIFKYPDLYHTAIAVAPVANQRYYDTIYQERYMGLPRDNVAGFRDGSPINFAKQLKGNLMLIHGTGDDNCHYQATEALINELIRHNKPFDMMAYPNRTHAIREGRNTTRHLRAVMTRYLTEKLPPGPRATAPTTDLSP